jgi:hypothetical protein
VRRAAGTSSAALACALGALACVLGALAFACSDGPTTTGPGAATRECAPLDEPGATVIAAGLTKDGHYVVVVTRAGGARVFYGVAAHLVEGVITAMPPGCAVEVDFTIDGRTEVATFSPGPPGCAAASTLTSGNAGDAIVHIPLAVLVPADAGGVGDAGAAGDAGGDRSLAALAFYCL